MSGLVNYNIPKETFVATAAIIASVVDITRIPVYILGQRDVITDNALLLLITTASAFAGTFAGKSDNRGTLPVFLRT